MGSQRVRHNLATEQQQQTSYQGQSSCSSPNTANHTVESPWESERRWDPNTVDELHCCSLIPTTLSSSQQGWFSCRDSPFLSYIIDFLLSVGLFPLIYKYTLPSPFIVRTLCTSPQSYCIIFQLIFTTKFLKNLVYISSPVFFLSPFYPLLKLFLIGSPVTPTFQIQSSVLTFLDSLSAFRSHPLYDLNQIPYDYTVKVTNRFKGIDLIDRVPEEIRWRFVTLYRR